MRNCQYYHPYLNCRAQILLNAYCKEGEQDTEKLREILKEFHLDADMCLRCRKLKEEK